MNLPGTRYLALVRRELWEHRVLWMAPLLISVLLVLLPLLIGGDRSDVRGVSPEIGGEAAARMFGRAIMMGSLLTLGGVAMLTIFVYLLDCLYGERKDRSILFWKSLPVSDSETVLAKLAVGVVLVPLFAVLLAMLVQPLMMASVGLRFEGVRELSGITGVLGGWKLLPQYLVAWLYGVLWYSPGIAWLLVASVLAKRAPMMYALLPPLAVFLIEGILLQNLLDDRPLSRFLVHWLAPWTREDWAWNSDPMGGMIPGVGSPDWSVLFTNPSLWVGLAVAAGMVYIVIRLRRYRDDT